MQDALIQFAEWIDQNFPAVASLGAQLQHDELVFSHLIAAARTDYATAVLPGPCMVRPWNLGFRSDFSFTSFAEPDDMSLLIETIVRNGSRAEPTGMILFCNAYYD